MKVLIVHPHMSLYGGAELVIVKFSNYLTKNGIDNAVLTLSMLDEIKKDLKGTKLIIPKEKKEDKKGILKFFDFVGDMIILQKNVHKYRKEYDIVNVHNFPAEYCVFPFVKKSVWMCNEPPMQLYLMKNLSAPTKILARVVEKFDKFLVKNFIKCSIVADEFNFERFKKIYGIEPEIINYGIDYDFFSNGKSNNVMKKFKLKNNFVLIHVGTLTPLKNQIESIKIVEQLREKIPKIKLILAGWGDNDYKNMLEKYVIENKLENNVIFTGHISRELIRDLYKASNVALFPIKSQGGWLSPFEALCSGIPVVVSSFITSSDMIEKNKIGIVTDDFCQTIMKIYKNKKLYKKMGEHGKYWVENNLKWENFSEKMLDVFENIS
jgi:glycosyltransferase involved in cell wall biosynthesis